MYEQGNNPAYERTPLHHGVSLAVHESQSRMWEKPGRSIFAVLEIFLPAP